jgi:hypothetical protein
MHAAKGRAALWHSFTSLTKNKQANKNMFWLKHFEREKRERGIRLGRGRERDKRMSNIRAGET